MFKLDRTAFRANTFASADDQIRYWRKRSPAERLLAADFLIRQAWGIAPDAPMRVDRSVAKIRIRRMANVFNSDFKDFIDALNRSGVAYLLVGGYAVILHGYSRTTGDLDIWVQPTSDNYQLLELAFADFGMPMFDMTEANFLAPDKFDVFTFGVPPSAIDLMTRVKGLVFEEVYAQSSIYEFEDLAVRVINHRDLIAAKLAAGRYRDLNDVEQLRKIEEE